MEVNATRNLELLVSRDWPYLREAKSSRIRKELLKGVIWGVGNKIAFSGPQTRNSHCINPAQLLPSTQFSIHNLHNGWLASGLQLLATAGHSGLQATRFGLLVETLLSPKEQVLRKDDISNSADPLYTLNNVIALWSCAGSWRCLGRRGGGWGHIVTRRWGWSFGYNSGCQSKLNDIPLKNTPCIKTLFWRKTHECLKTHNLLPPNK